MENSMYTDNNTNVSILRKLPCDGYTLKDFYNDSKDKHFWFVKTEIGPYMRFMHSAYTTGKWWWKHYVDECKCTLNDSNIYDSKMLSTFENFFLSRLPKNVYVDIVATPHYTRTVPGIFHGAFTICSYDYNVVAMGDDEGLYPMDKLMDKCKEFGLNPPYYEEGEFVFLPLGEIFKSFEKFDQYVKECEDLNYELNLVNAD